MRWGSGPVGLLVGFVVGWVIGVGGVVYGHVGFEFGCDDGGIVDLVSGWAE